MTERKSPEIDIDLVLERLLPTKLLKMFSDCNNVTAAKAAAEHLERLNDQRAVEQHSEKLAGLLGKPVALAGYFGRLELPKRDLREALGGRDLTHDEVAAYQQGRRSRAAEMRALELHRTRRGGRIEHWMTRC